MDPSTDSQIKPFGADDIAAVKDKDAQLGMTASKPAQPWDGTIATDGIRQNGDMLSLEDDGASDGPVTASGSGIPDGYGPLLTGFVEGGVTTKRNIIASPPVT